MYNVQFINGSTEDGLKLQGVHWNSNIKDTCIVCIHGMGGNIIENNYSHIFGKIFTENNIGFIFGHNRGYSHMNNIETVNGEYRRIGTTFEIFEECEYDIDLWVNKAIELGYKKVVLLGHSLGCNKCIYYLSKNKNKNIEGLILASPPDMLGLTKYQVPNFNELFKEAEDNIKNGNNKKLLSAMVDDLNYKSSESYINWFTEGSNCDNIPILRNPEKFDQLSTIDVKIFAFSGEKENVVYKRFDLLKEKALSCKDFQYTIIKDSDHIYKNVEENVANIILEWMNK